MVCKELFEIIDSMNEIYLDVWEDVANLESPSEYKEGVDAVGKYFADMANERGWKVEFFEQEKAGNVVCITMNPEAPLKPITFSGHIDTVHPVGSFGSPAVRRDEKKIYGPGVMDCKGGVVAAFMAMDALKKYGFLTRPVRLLLQTDEEANSALSGKATIEYICRKSKDSCAFLNCESSRRGTLVLWRKGIIRYRYDVCGKGIHSSRCAEGASAVLEAAHKIIELEKFKDEDGITCNCGVINGGNAQNTVPDSCTFYADIRFSTTDELILVKKKTAEVAEKSTVKGTSCVVTQTGFRPAMEYSKENINLFDTMNRIFVSNGLPELTARKSLGGSDAADVTDFGIPCIDSVGVEGDFIHTVREYALLDSLSEAAKRLAAVAYCL